MGRMHRAANVWMNHSRHWVFRITSKKSSNFNSILHELSTKKDVNEVSIADHIDECQNLKNQHSECPDIMSVDSLDKLLGNY